MANREVLVLIDRSHSMKSIWGEVEGEYKGYIEKMQEKAPDERLTVAVFDTDYDVIVNRKKIKNAPDELGVGPRGMTALYDAVGKMLADSKAKKAMVVIITDGMENSSQEYSYDAVQSLIESRKEIGWEFVFLSSDLQATQVGKNWGATTVHNEGFMGPQGPQGIFENLVSNTTSYYHTGATFSADAWDLPEDDESKGDAV